MRDERLHYVVLAAAADASHIWLKAGKEMGL